MITPDRLRLRRVVISPDVNEPGNAIVAQASLGAGGILQRSGFLPRRASTYRPPPAPERADYRLPAGLTREQQGQAAVSRGSRTAPPVGAEPSGPIPAAPARSGRTHYR
ncbi:hypothetical protein [Kitasatospora sp. NPDC050463]|uniref:hypothetical protein n=1 Tax=Kitasatospora sp. NPDC050463 TaxID=3155786 RepID=UPI0033ED1918